MLPDDLAQLRHEFPEWRFGTVWASAATGPDARRMWARHAELLLSAWNAPDLRAAIQAEHEGDSGDSGAS